MRETPLESGVSETPLGITVIEYATLMEARPTGNHAKADLIR